jgi:hypothetical protein
MRSSRRLSSVRKVIDSEIDGAGLLRTQCGANGYT